MKIDSFALRYELFFATATVGAHAYADENGFRQRDVRFYIELFSNWIESSTGLYAIPVKNTQVSRYIDSLISEGYARKVSRKGRPRYRLTRIGLIELISRVIDRNYLQDKEQFFFLFYFLKSYKPRLEELVQLEGKRFPYALKVELDNLLDPATLLKKELTTARDELKKLNVRIGDAEKTSTLARQGLLKKEAIEDIIEAAERLYPYELNSQKPLTELMKNFPRTVQEWEMQHGNAYRATIVWRSSKQLLESYIHTLERLSDNL